MKFGSTGRLAVAAFAAAAFSVATYAQDTAGTTAERAQADRDQIVTVTGCLFQEQQVPGRDANLFQRWGLQQQDFVLTNVQPKPAAQPGQQAGQAGQQPGQQPGQPGTAQQPQPVAPHAALHADRMLKIEGKEAEQLRQHANQQVEIRGKLDDRGWYERAMRHDPARDPAAPVGTAGVDEKLTSIEVESIRAIGPCPQQQQQQPQQQPQPSPQP